MQTFQLYSDIHLEMKNDYPKIERKAEYLILAGDIGNVSNENFIQFISYCSSTWNKVFYVFGNHEFYSKITINNILVRYRDFFDSFENVHLLNNSYFELNNVILYGFIGWTKPIFDSTNKARNRLSDYNMIRTINGLITIDDIASMSENSINKFREFLSISSEKDIIVITHFPPIRNGTSDEKYKGDMLQPYFSWNNLLQDENIASNDRIKIWCSGHTHHSYDFVVDSIRYVSNQIGYSGECNCFTDLTFEV